MKKTVLVILVFLVTLFALSLAILSLNHATTAEVEFVDGRTAEIYYVPKEQKPGEYIFVVFDHRKWMYNSVKDSSRAEKVKILRMGE